MRKLLLFFVLLFVAAVFVFPAAAGEAKSWTERVKLSGDIRYRHDLIAEEKAANPDNVRVPDRNRHRLRLRFGLQAEVNPQLDLLLRLASGGSDPVSTNQDLGDGFSAKEIWIDRAYLEYHPVQSFAARAGKFGVPFEGTELLWDSDLSLEGIAILPRLKLEQGEMFLRGGGFWAAERKSSDGPDQGLFGAQFGGVLKNTKSSALLAVGFFDFGNVKNGPTLYSMTNGYGNTVRTYRTQAYYVSDFNLLNICGSAGNKFEHVEAIVTGDWVVNTGAEPIPGSSEKRDTGWLAGITLKFAAPLKWQMQYNYRSLDADAVIGAFSDSDAGGGGTNLNGHKLAAAATIMPGTLLGVSYYRNIRDPDGAKLTYNRLQVDVEAKF